MQLNRFFCFVHIIICIGVYLHYSHYIIITHIISYVRMYYINGISVSDSLCLPTVTRNQLYYSPSYRSSLVRFNLLILIEHMGVFFIDYGSDNCFFFLLVDN